MEKRNAEAGPFSPEPGTPHPDPALAALGWHTGPSGVYERPGQSGRADVEAIKNYAASLRAQADREAG